MENYFKQWEPPTNNKLIQINLGDKEHLKPIIISGNLSPTKQDDMIQLVWEYIDVFAWIHEDMSDLAPQVAMHHSTSSHVWNLSSSNNEEFSQR